MAAPGNNPGRDIALSLLAALVIGGAIVAYVLHGVPSRQELIASGPHLVESDAGAQALGAMDAATKLVSLFSTALAAHRYADAYALMAAPYRASNALTAFESKCKSSPFLAGAQSAGINSTRRATVPGGNADTYTFQGQGVWTAAQGSVDASFVFWVDHGRAHILVMSLAGIPVLDGVSH